MNQYGAELVTKTLWRIHIEMPHLVDNFQKLVPSEKQKASRGLLISLLQGDSLPEEHDIFDEF